MLVLGLTGSIGMGKSTAVAMLRDMGLPVHDADAVVHRLMEPDGAAAREIARAFPDVVRDGEIDRQRLGEKVFEDAEARRRLEAILHPLVRQSARAFVREQESRGADVVVLDIPLLFETGGEKLCDAVAVVTAPREVQEKRVLARPGMTRERFDAIVAAQMPDSEKRERADFVVPTEFGEADTLRRLEDVISRLRSGDWTPASSGAGRRRRSDDG